MRSRCIRLGLGGLLVLLVAAASSAATNSAVVLHPAFSRVERPPRQATCSVTALPATSGPYVLLPTSNCGLSLFDDATGSKAPVHLRADNVQAFGAPWIFVTRTSSPRGELYNFLTKTSRPLGCGSRCFRGGPVSPIYQLGSRWLEVSWQSCQEFLGRPVCGAVTHSFYNLETHAFRKRVSLDSRHVIDLDSPNLNQRVCSPLRVPTGGSLALEGRFAIATNQDGTVFLERCGSHLHMAIDPGAAAVEPPWAANTRTVVWPEWDVTGAWHGRFDGIFLPSLRRFSFTVGPKIKWEGSSGRPVLDNSRLYLLDAYSAVWSTSLTSR